MPAQHSTPEWVKRAEDKGSRRERIAAKAYDRGRGEWDPEPRKFTVADLQRWIERESR